MFNQPDNKIIYDATPEQLEQAPIGRHGQRLASSATEAKIAGEGKEVQGSLAAILLTKVAKLRKR